MEKTCKGCFHYQACKGMLEAQGFSISENHVGNAEKCDTFVPIENVVLKSNEGAECPICHGLGRIGTTDWLTKNMSKKQLAEEKAKAIAEHERHIKSEVAKKIFEEIEASIAVYAFTNNTEDYADGVYDTIE